jgi:hypothetical protein
MGSRQRRLQLTPFHPSGASIKSTLLLYLQLVTYQISSSWFVCTRHHTFGSLATTHHEWIRACCQGWMSPSSSVEVGELCSEREFATMFKLRLWRHSDVSHGEPSLSSAHPVVLPPHLHPRWARLVSGMNPLADRGSLGSHQLRGDLRPPDFC